MSTPEYHSLQTHLDNLAAKSQDLIEELKNSKIKVQSSLKAESMDQLSKREIETKLDQIMEKLQDATMRW
jgi:hypothetical protein